MRFNLALVSSFLLASTLAARPDLALRSDPIPSARVIGNQSSFTEYLDVSIAWLTADVTVEMEGKCDITVVELFFYLWNEDEGIIGLGIEFKRDANGTITSKAFTVVDQDKTYLNINPSPDGFKMQAAPQFVQIRNMGLDEPWRDGFQSGWNELGFTLHGQIPGGAIVICNITNISIMLSNETTTTIGTGRIALSYITGMGGKKVANTTWGPNFVTFAVGGDV